MNNTKQLDYLMTKRTLGNFDDLPLLESGARIEDEIHIYPFQGYKKKLSLNRTKYEIQLASSYKSRVNSFEIELPDMKKNIESFSGGFELILCPRGQNYKKIDEWRYILKSKCNIPFCINGVYSMEAFVQRGDCIEIGLNKLYFLQRLKDNKIYEHEILKNKKIIESDINLLLEGETGTGKSYLAKEVHEKSGRSGRFVHLNLSSFSENLIESEIFGHIKGSFTGASCDKSGAIWDATYGTLFLDEIDSLPISIQTKLLLFLDSKKIRAVGSNTERKVDLRIIFASGKDLKSMVSAEKFRIDFFHRISSGITIKLESLQENKLLIEYYCDFFCLKNNASISPSLLSFYKERSWPGNIRQLLGHLNKKLILQNNNRLIFDGHDSNLLDDYRYNEFNQSKFKTLEEVKHNYIYNTYMNMNKSTTTTAKILDISFNTVRNAIKKMHDPIRQ